MVKVDVEYCGYCDFESRCEDLAKVVKMLSPDSQVKCHRGRKGAFEVKVDETLVYSKLETENFPNFNQIAKVVLNASEGKPIVPLKESGVCRLM